MILDNIISNEATAIFQARHSQIFHDTGTTTQMNARHLRRLAASASTAPWPLAAATSRAAPPNGTARLLMRATLPPPSSSCAAFSTARERFASSYARQRRQQEDASGSGLDGSGKRATESQPLHVDRIAVIGGGNMADAIVTGVLSEDLIPSEKIVISDPNPGRSIRVLCWYC